MTLINKPKLPQDHHIFECKACKVVYMTDDHTPVVGKKNQVEG
jgi:hypothetical protein